MTNNDDKDLFSKITPAPKMTLRSDDIQDDAEKGLIFRDPNIGGENLSPQLSWSDFPEGTKSFAITCFDPDAPTGQGFMHWAVANIPLSVTSLERGAGSGGDGMPAGSLTLPNDVRMRQYIGANPPPNSGRHRYIFTVHAVGVEKLEIDPELTPVVLGFNLHFNTLARGVITTWVDSVEIGEN